jgi:hypothetical protein
MSWLEAKDSEPERCGRMDLQAIGYWRGVGYKYGVCNTLNSDLLRRIDVIEVNVSRWEEEEKQRMTSCNVSYVSRPLLE